MYLPFSTDVQTRPVSATDTVDFSPTNNRRIVFGVGETSFSFKIDIVDDDVLEQIESLEVRLYDVLGGELGTPNVASIFIEDDDGKRLYR